MLEEVEALGLDLTIDYMNKIWCISTIVENHGTEQGIGKKFEDALEVLKLRLAMVE